MQSFRKMCIISISISLFFCSALSANNLIGDSQIAKGQFLSAPQYPFIQLCNDSTVFIQFRVAKEDVEAISIEINSNRSPMLWFAHDSLFDYYYSVINSRAETLTYKFIVFDGDATAEFPCDNKPYTITHNELQPSRASYETFILTPQFLRILTSFLNNTTSSTKFINEYLDYIAKYTAANIEPEAISITDFLSNIQFENADDMSKTCSALTMIFTMLTLASTIDYESPFLQFSKMPQCEDCGKTRHGVFSTDSIYYIEMLYLLRSNYKIFSQGSIYHYITPDPTSLVVFKKLDNEHAAIFVNTSSHVVQHTIRVPQHYYTDMLTGHVVMTESDIITLEIKPYSTRVITFFK